MYLDWKNRPEDYYAIDIETDGLDAKVNVSELQQTLNKYAGESQQKAFELRQELFKKVSEIQSLVSAGVGTKVSIEEFNEGMS